MQRAIAIFAGGIVLGLLIAFGFTRTPQSHSAATVANTPAPASDANVSGGTDSTSKSNAEAGKIILGNIATVPFQELFAVLSARSPEEMAQLALQLNDLPSGRDTKTRITTFFKAWAHLDANAALASATALKTTEARSIAIGSVLGGADAAVANALAKTLNQLPADALPATQKTRFLNTAISKWSEVDPVAAATFLDGLPAAGPGFFGARVAVAQNWAASDPAAALAWVQTKGDTQEARIAMSGVINGWWENDPQAAQTYVLAHLDNVGMEVIMRITTQLFQQDPQQARDWANRLTTPEARRTAESFIAMQMAEADPKAASEFAARLPDETRSRALSAVISRWARNDPAAVGQWINGLDGRVRDEAIGVYSSVVASNDPSAGLTWAASLSDATVRSSTMERIVSSWMRRSPTDATAWIQRSNLPEAEKTKLLALPIRR